jgi:hypothetical protein
MPIWDWLDSAFFEAAEFISLNEFPLELDEFISLNEFPLELDCDV